MPEPHVDDVDTVSKGGWEHAVRGVGGAVQAGLNFLAGNDRSLPSKQDEGFKDAVLSKLFTGSLDMEALDLAEAGYRDGDMPRLADALAQNERVKHLNLSTNAITPIGAGQLATGLEQNKSLTYLDIGENQVQVAGMLSLCNFVAIKPSLAALDVASNRISDRGCVALCHALANAPGVPIQFLNLSENALSDESATALATLLPKARKLAHLDISRSNFAPRAIQALAQRSCPRPHQRAVETGGALR